MMRPAVGRQERLFYEFDLEERILDDHLLRRIDAVLDLSWLRGDLALFYSHTGCPSVDPELMVRMLLIGYCYSIRRADLPPRATKNIAWDDLELVCHRGGGLSIAAHDPGGACDDEIKN